MKTFLVILIVLTFVSAIILLSPILLEGEIMAFSGVRGRLILNLFRRFLLISLYFNTRRGGWAVRIAGWPVFKAGLFFRAAQKVEEPPPPPSATATKPLGSEKPSVPPPPEPPLTTVQSTSTTPHPTISPSPEGEPTDGAKVFNPPTVVSDFPPTDTRAAAPLEIPPEERMLEPNFRENSGGEEEPHHGDEISVPVGDGEEPPRRRKPGEFEDFFKKLKNRVWPLLTRLWPFFSLTLIGLKNCFFVDHCGVKWKFFYHDPFILGLISAVACPLSGLIRDNSERFDLLFTPHFLPGHSGGFCRFAGGFSVAHLFRAGFWLLAKPDLYRLLFQYFKKRGPFAPAAPAGS